MNKLCNDNWLEIFSYLSGDDIIHLRKSRLLDDSKWKIYVELNLLKKYPSIYQDLITYQDNWGKTFRDIISPFNKDYLAPIDSIELYFELERYYTTRNSSIFNSWNGYYMETTETFVFDDGEFKKADDKFILDVMVKSHNFELMKLHLCRLTEISNNFIHTLTSRSLCPNKFAEFILCVFLHDQRCDIEYVLKRMICRGYYDEIMKYYELNQLDISANDNYILNQALEIHQDYKARKEAEKRSEEPEYWYESYFPGASYYCYRKYPTPFINELLKNESVLGKIPDGLVNYLILTDSKLDVQKATDLLTKSTFPYKKNDIFKNIFESENEELINLMLSNPTFKSSLYHYLNTHRINHQKLLKYSIMLDDIKNFLILTYNQSSLDTMRMIVSNPNSNLTFGRQAILEHIIYSKNKDLIDLLLNRSDFLPTIIYFIKHPKELSSWIRDPFFKLTSYWRSITD